MKRVAVALLVACGPPARTTSAVPIPLAATSSTPPPHVSIVHEPGLALIAYYHVCVVAHGKVRCRDAMTPDVPFSKEPVLKGLEGLDVKQAALGRDFACAVLRSGDVDCWGGNHFGQLGANIRDGNHEAPVAVVNLHGVERVFTGPGHACATTDGGKVACWGKNQFGENGSTTQYLEAARELVEPQVVPGVDGVVEMALGWDATYAATSTGSVIAWGRRKLKEEPATPEWTEQPRVLASLDGTTSLTSNEETFCGVLRDKVICWGQTYSFLANGVAPHEIATIPVEHAKRVRIAQMHGCAIDASGSVWCFGMNNEGQLGSPADKGYTASPPMKVPDVARAVDVICTSAMSCALTSSDELWCWGRFTYDDEVVHPPTKIAL